MCWREKNPDYHSATVKLKQKKLSLDFREGKRNSWFIVSWANIAQLCRDFYCHQMELARIKIVTVAAEREKNGKC